MVATPDDFTFHHVNDLLGNVCSTICNTLQVTGNEEGIQQAFRVIQVPMAPVLIHDRRKGPEKQIVTSVTSYMNFIISNSLIVLPSYVSENSDDRELIQKEAQVEHIFKEVFPSRDIVKVRADTLNYYSGGFHCISIHDPGVKK